jgi:lactoylglutathione lyase
LTVGRVVPIVTVPDLPTAVTRYRAVLGLEVVMDHGWIVTLAAPGTGMTPQLGIASEGGSGTPVPDLSIEVDDVDAVHGRALALRIPIAYGPTDEPWGVRRFFLRDPAGRLVNVLAHR